MTKKEKTVENKTVKIKLPREKGKEGLLVSINGKNTVIPRGVTCEVPVAVAELIADSERMLEESDRFRNSVITD